MATRMARKQKQHYVDNKKFLEEITKYRLAVESAKRNDEEKPRISHYPVSYTHLTLPTKA